MIRNKNYFFSLIWVLVFSMTALPSFAQHDGHNHDGHDHSGHSHATEQADSHAADAHGAHDDSHYDAGATVLHHIGDANEFHVWKGVHIPLPCILYAPDKGFDFFMSSAFDHGHKSHEGYVINHGRVNRINDPAYHGEELHIDEITHVMEATEEGKEKEVYYAVSHGKKYRLDKPSTWDGEIMGGGVTSFYDFSITKNVFTMLLATILLLLVFTRVAKGYKQNEGKAPKGIQSLVEPILVFLRDEVTIPMIGKKHYERFQPYIFTLFFFILFCNLLGLVPFFPGSANVTGNIGVTMTLAVVTFLVVNLNGKKDYWEHTLWMPGVPGLIKLFILTPVEILGLVIKPFSLMIRLFANITAGHIIILSLVGLIFVFGKNGTDMGGATAGVIVGGLFTLFMNLIELIVAFVQAFIFSMLSASYIGAAVEEHDHH